MILHSHYNICCEAFSSGPSNNAYPTAEIEEPKYDDHGDKLDHTVMHSLMHDPHAFVKKSDFSKRLIILENYVNIHSHTHIFKCSNVQMFKFSNVQMFKSSN